MKNHPNKDRAILAAGLAALTFVAAACVDAAGPDESTVARSSSPVSVTSTATTEPEITPVTEPSEVIGGGASYVETSDPFYYEEDDGYSASSMNSLDQAALATLAQAGVYCPSDDECLNAVASMCIFQEMGYTSNDIYIEMAMYPNEQMLPPFSNSDIPHLFGVANGGYCAGM